MGPLIVILLIAWLVFMIYVQLQARMTVHVVTSKGKLAVQEIVDHEFSRIWTRTSGPGHINVKPKLRAHAPTISIDVDSAAGGGCEVDIWMSAWTTRYLVRAHSQLVWRKKRSLALALQDPVEIPLASETGALSATSEGPTRPPETQPLEAPKPAVSNGGSSLSAEAKTVGANGAVVKLLNDSDTNLVLRTQHGPTDLVEQLRRVLDDVKPGSMTHLLIGPPRATMWAHVAVLSSGETMLVISLVTKDKPDREFVRTHVQGPLTLRVARSLDTTVESVDGASVTNGLREDIMNARIVPVSELGL